MSASLYAGMGARHNPYDVYLYMCIYIYEKVLSVSNIRWQEADLSLTLPSRWLPNLGVPFWEFILEELVFTPACPDPCQTAKKIVQPSPNVLRNFV